MSRPRWEIYDPRDGTVLYITPRRKSFSEAIDAGEERIRVLEQFYPNTLIGQKWARALLRPQRTAAPVEEEDYSDEYRRGYDAAMRRVREVLRERTAERQANIASRDFKGSELTHVCAAEAELTRFSDYLWLCRLPAAKSNNNNSKEEGGE